MLNCLKYMKIKNFIPSPHFAVSGLNIKEMRNLKQVVAVFGKNGSGKTRLLNTLNMEIQSKALKWKELNGIIRESAHFTGKTGDIAAEKRLTGLLAREEMEKLSLDFDFKDGDDVIVINNRGSEISSSRNMNDNDYRNETLNIIINPRFDTVKQNCAKLVKALTRSEIAKDYHKGKAGKAYFKAHDEIQDRNIELFSHLKEVVHAIMNKKLDYSVDEHLTPIVTLDGRELDTSDLSDGEKELFAYSTYLVLQRQYNHQNKTLSLKNKILIIDELELFLHPKAQIDLIKGLRDLVGEDGQIWIATHSLAVLSILDRDEIWLMENGSVVSPSIETPNMVLTSLIGEDNINSLENFLSSQYEWASIQFALESLFPPNVAPHKEGDVQQGQVKEIFGASNKPIKILDFGAGKGRVAEEILRSPSIASNLYYQALEPTKDLHSSLEKLSSQLQVLSSIAPEIEREVLDSYEKLKESKYISSFDYILMINVLHEIPLNKWHSLLNAVLGSLKEDGKIIFLEDQAIPRGENAHEYGFLIFGIEEFKILFSQNSNFKVHKHAEPKYSERLTCLGISKKGSAVTQTSINDALMRKKANCKTEINSLRRKKIRTPTDGRKNAFLTQLYANVDMALADSKE